MQTQQPTALPALRGARDSRDSVVVLIVNLMTTHPVMVAYRCSSHLEAATFQISTNKKANKNTKVEIRTYNKVQITAAREKENIRTISRPER